MLSTHLNRALRRRERTIPGLRFLPFPLRLPSASCAARLGGLAALGLVLAACTSSKDPGPIPPAVGVSAQVATDAQGNFTTTGRVAGNSSIPVLVNDVPITAYDISQRAKLIALGGGKGGTKAATDELIDETLETLEGMRRGVNVPDAQVNLAFASIAERLKMTPDQFSKALGSQGVSADTLKKRIKAQITWQQLVQMRTQQKAQVKSEDVTAALLKENKQSLTVTEYTLQQIVFVVPSGSGPAVYTQRRQEAEAFRQRFKGCDQSLAQAQQLHGVVVKEIGRRDSTQLTGPVGDAVQKTPAGKVAPPDQIEGGIELIAVCSTREVASSDAARTEITNNLYLKQAEGLGKDYLAELHSRAIIEYH